MSAGSPFAEIDRENARVTRESYARRVEVSKVSVYMLTAALPTQKQRFTRNVVVGGSSLLYHTYLTGTML